jgi:predicted Rossmann-fold nucleotide-binding protein
MGSTRSLYHDVKSGRAAYHKQLLALADDCGHRFRTTIFGSARLKRDSEHFSRVSRFSWRLKMEEIDRVTGAGPGVMEAANEGIDPDSVSVVEVVQETQKQAKSRSIGVSLLLPFESVPNGFVDYDFSTEDFGMRLDLFGVFGTCHVYAHRGGVGTLLELLYFLQLHQIQRQQGMKGVNKCLFPVHPSVQLGYIPKIIVVGSLYDHLFRQFDEMVKMGMFNGNEVEFLMRAADYDVALEMVLQARTEWRGFLIERGIQPLN